MSSTFPFMRHAVRIACGLACAASLATLSGCGGGGSADSIPDTIRPKTMNGVVLTLDTGAKLTFVRSGLTAGAIHNGDIETGSFIYTPLTNYDITKTYPNIGGTKTNFGYPQSVTAGTYSYKATSDSQGTLQLTGTGTASYYFTYFVGTSPAGNLSWMRPFYRTSLYTDDYVYDSVGKVTGYNSTVNLSNLVDIDVSFESTSGAITTSTVTIKQPDSKYVNSFDTVRVPSQFSLSTGGALPENYIDDQAFDGYSPILPDTLSGLVMHATNGIPDTTKDFTLQFTKDVNADLTTYSGSAGFTPEEIGTAILSVYDTNTNTVQPISPGIDYAYARTKGGSDTATLVLSNIPDNPNLPFDVSLNGTYELDFSGTDVGKYIGAVDADTTNAADVSGDFQLIK